MFYILGAGKTYNDLFDIGRNTKDLKGAELKFYNDQCTTRICRLSEEIDIEYEKEQEEIFAELQMEEEFSNPAEFKEILNHTPRSERSSSSADKRISINPQVTPPMNSTKSISGRKQSYSPRPDIHSQVTQRQC